MCVVLLQKSLTATITTNGSSKSASEAVIDHHGKFTRLFCDKFSVNFCTTLHLLGFELISSFLLSYLSIFMSLSLLNLLDHSTYLLIVYQSVYVIDVHRAPSSTATARFPLPLSVWPHLFGGAGHEKRRGEQLKWSMAFRL